ncbi:MAG: T9SS type A sorting domain-containing protein [Reichenbachiella sp.]
MKLNSNQFLKVNQLILALFLSSTIYAQPITSFPYLEDFEAGKNGWSADNNYYPQTSETGWELGQPSGDFINTAYSGSNAWVTNLDGNYAEGDNYQFLISPIFDFSNFSEDPLLSFYMIHELDEYEEAYVFMEYSLDGGENWEDYVGAFDSGGVNWYSNYNEDDYWGGSISDWAKSTHNLKDMAGEDSVRLRWVFNYYEGGCVKEGFGIDDVSITESENRPDIELTNIEALINSNLTNNEEIEIGLKANLKNVEDLSITVDVSGPLNYSETQNDPDFDIAQGEIEYYTISNLDFSNIGVYTVEITASTTGDLITENNTRTVLISNLTTVSNFPYSEDFENGPGGWAADNYDVKGWELGNPHPRMENINSAFSGDNAWVTNLDGYYGEDGDYYLYSPIFDFSNLVDPVLKLAINYDTETYSDEIWVEYSTNDGVNWEVLGEVGSGGVNWYNDYNDGWLDNSGGWKEAAHRLTELGGESTVRLRIYKYYGGDLPLGEGAAIDNIQIEEGSLDVELISVVPLIRNGLGSNENLTLEVKSNFGSITEIDVSVTVTGIGTFNHSETFSALDMLEGESSELTLTGLDFSSIGTYHLEITVDVSSDMITSNNTLHSTVVNRNEVISSYPYFENFESGIGEWIIDNQGNSHGWEHGIAEGTLLNQEVTGNKSIGTNMKGDYSSYGNYFIYSPQFDFTTVVDPFISFNMSHDVNDDDELYLEYSIDHQLTWSTLSNDALISKNWYAEDDGYWSGQSDEWINAWHSLDHLKGENSVVFRFSLISDAVDQGEGVIIDNIKIIDEPMEIAILSVKAPVRGGLGSDEEITITVESLENTVTEIDVNVTVVGKTTSSIIQQNFSGLSISSGHTDELTLTGFDFTEKGNYDLHIEINSPNDYNYANNQLKSNAISLLTIQQFPYQIDFESGDGGWVAANSTSDGWEYGTPSGRFEVPPYSGQNVWKTNLDGRHAADALDYLYTPVFDFTNLNEDPSLSTFIYTSFYNYFGTDHSAIEYSLDNGTSWNLLGSESSGYNWYETASGWNGYNNVWKEAAHPLVGFAGESVILRFKIESDSDANKLEGLTVDNFKIGLSPADIGIMSLDAPFASGLTNSESINVEVKALFQTINDVDVTLEIKGPLTYSVVKKFQNLDIDPESTISLAINDLDFAIPGSYVVKATVQTPDDLIKTNNTSYTTVANLMVVNEYPYEDDFENGGAGWFGENIVLGQYDSIGWELGTPNPPLNASTIQNAHSGSNAWVTVLEGRFKKNGLYYLYSPKFDLSSNTEDPTLSFHFLNSNNNTSSYVEYSIDEGQSWNQLGSSTSGGINWTQNNSGGNSVWKFSGSKDDWISAQHKLTGLGGESSVIIRFVLNSINSGTEGDGLGIDDVNVFYDEGIASFPYYEDFENGDGGWKAQNRINPGKLSGIYGWENETPTDTYLNAAHSGTKSWITHRGSNYLTRAHYDLFSPSYDFSEFENDPILSFFNNWKIANNDYATVYYSINDGISWIKLGTSVSGGKNWYNVTSGFQGTSSDWVESAHELTNLAGEGNVRFKVYLISSNTTLVDEGMAIDDIRIGELISDAGENQTICGSTTTLLSAKQPIIGSGEWMIINNSDGLGVVSEPSNPNSEFIGTAGQTYTLEWSIDPEGGSFLTPSNDQVIITFENEASITIANAGDDQALCNTTTMLDANSANVGNQETGMWSIIEGAGGAIETSDDPLTIFSGIAGESYLLEWNISTAAGCNTLDYVTITFENLPSTSIAGADQTICGTTALLNASIPEIGSGIWSVLNGEGGSFDDARKAATIFSGSEGTTYSLAWTVDNGNCTMSTDEVTIEFVSPPTVAEAGNDQSLCGTITTLEANEANSGSGSWSIISGENGIIENHSAPESLFTGVAGNTYVLKWEIDNQTCTPSSSIVSIHFDESPSQANAGSDQFLCNINFTNLSAAVPTVGQGEWRLIKGVEGSILNSLDPNSEFSGIYNQEYVLEWIVSNEGCDETKDDVIVQFNQTPSLAQAGDDQTVCGPVNLQGNIPEIGIGSWEVLSGTGGLIDREFAASSIFSGEPGEVYTLRWSIDNGGCTSTSDDVMITFDNNSPTIAMAGEDQDVCGALSTTLAANTPTQGEGRWEITFGSGGSLDDPSSPNTQFSGIADKTYVLQWIIDSNGCSQSEDEVIIAFDAMPTEAIAGENQEVCGQWTNLEGNEPVEGLGQWTIESGDNGYISDPDEFDSSFKGAPGETYTLQWTIKNGSCSESMDQVVLSFFEDPTIAIAGDDQSLCGAQTTLAGNHPEIGLGTWTVLSGTGGSFDDIHDPESLFSGSPGINYTLRWTINSGSCQNSSDEVDIMIDAASPDLANAGDDMILCGNTFNLSGNHPNIGSGEWSIISGTGGSIGNSNSNTSSFEGVQGETYVLRWTVTQEGCSSSSDEMSVTFEENPSISNAGDDQSSCSASTILDGNIPTIGSGSWAIISGTSGIISTPNVASSEFRGEAGQSYVLEWRISNGSCSASMDQVSITFDENVETANAGNDQSVCSVSTTLSASAPTVGTGIWHIISGSGGIVSTPASESSEFNGLAGQTYVLEWSVSNGSCSTSVDQVSITLDENSSISNAGENQSNCSTSTILNGNIPLIGSGSWAIISGTGGVISTPNVASSEFRGEAGQSYVLEWTITNGSCTVSTDQVSITFDETATIAIAGEDQAICSGNTTLSANAPTIGTGIWSINSGTGGVISDLSSPTSDFGGIEGETYVLSWVVTNGTCESMDEVTIEFNSTPSTPTITSTNGTTLETVDENQLTYIWYLDGEVIEGATSATLETAENGDYTVQSSNGDCLSAMSAPFNILITNTESIRERREIAMFPNPASNLIQFEINGHADYFVSIYDINGNKVMNQVEAIDNRMDISGLEAGVYLVRLRINGTSITRRLIKQ